MNNPTQLLPTSLIAVEVPKDAIKIKKFDLREYDEEGQGFSLEWLIKGNYFYDAKLIDIDFEILGEVTADEITFDVEDILESTEMGYTDYVSNKKGIGARKSFRSLLQSNGLYFVNPLNNDENLLREDCYVDWQEAESKVIKGKLVILKPI